MTVLLSLLALFLPFTIVAGVFAIRQQRLNHRMDLMDDSRRDARYVGPNVGGPF
ncbi:hypothetical protein [Deinococcus sonorensis]|uniref:Uncharacterized protein n=1 Tax=Deinococcus sonorensis TaxID=309891 RepID=A0ABV8Y819_9DEIO